jgi:hypothetical protein
MTWNKGIPLGLQFEKVELPIHPNDAEYVNAYDDNYHDDLHLYPAFYNNKEVEFNIVDFWETGLEEVIKVAEIIHTDNTKNQKTASKEFDDFLESVKAIPDQKPICEYSGLPSLTSYTDQQEDDVYEMAQTYAIESGSLNIESRRKGFVDGYNKAKETLYTEEQVKLAYMQGYNRGKDGNPNHMESYIQFLKQPK